MEFPNIRSNTYQPEKWIVTRMLHHIFFIKMIICLLLYQVNLVSFNRVNKLLKLTKLSWYRSKHFIIFLNKNVMKFLVTIHFSGWQVLQEALEAYYMIRTVLLEFYRWRLHKQFWCNFQNHCDTDNKLFDSVYSAKTLRQKRSKINKSYLWNVGEERNKIHQIIFDRQISCRLFDKGNLINSYVIQSPKAKKLTEKIISKVQKIKKKTLYKKNKK